MDSNVETGAGDQASEFVQRLGQLKQTGCNLLLVGRVPDDVLTAASRKLLGDATQPRHRLFVFTDSERAGLDQRLLPVDCRTTASSASVLTHAAGGFAPPTDESSGTSRIDVDGSLSDLAVAIDDEIAGFESSSGGLEPAQVRVCFDSVETLFADYDGREVAAFLEDVTASVEGANGMAHYVLPVEREHRAVAQLGSQFDAIIEYRTAEGGQERWHFPDGDLSTDWFPLR